MIKVVYEGIDSFNRPIFKDIDSKARYGDTDTLFPIGTKEETVLDAITESDLVFFGYRFDCEPYGSYVEDLLIVPKERV